MGIDVSKATLDFCIQTPQQSSGSRFKIRVQGLADFYDKTKCYIE